VHATSTNTALAEAVPSFSIVFSGTAHNDASSADGQDSSISCSVLGHTLVTSFSTAAFHECFPSSFKGRYFRTYSHGYPINISVVDDFVLPPATFIKANKSEASVHCLTNHCRTQSYHQMRLFLFLPFSHLIHRFWKCGVSSVTKAQLPLFLARMKAMLHLCQTETSFKKHWSAHEMSRLDLIINSETNTHKI
jgi:hypothetical protein